MNKLTVHDICVQGSPENGKRIIAAFEKLQGINKYKQLCISEELDYHLSDFNTIECYTAPPKKHLITIEQLEEMAGIKQEKTFPRMMWVWDDNENGAQKREVLADLSAFNINFPFIARNEDNSKTIMNWKHVKEIEEETPVKEMTIEQISKELGYEIKIVKS